MQEGCLLVQIFQTTCYPVSLLNFVNLNGHTKLTVRADSEGQSPFGTICGIARNQNSHYSTSGFNTKGDGMISKISEF